MRSFRQFFLSWSRIRKKDGVWDARDHPAIALPPSPAWRALYLAALLERDEDRMVQRISDTKKALRVRAHELFRTAGDNLQEESAIDDAFQALHALEQSMSACVHPQGLSDKGNLSDFDYQKGLDFR